MINDNERQEREQIKLKQSLDLLDNGKEQQHIKLTKPKNTIEVKSKNERL